VTKKGSKDKVGLEMEETGVGGPSVVGGNLHVAGGNVLSSSHISDGEAGGFESSSMLWVMWNQVVDRLQVLSNTFGLSYDMDTTLGEKVGKVRLPTFPTCASAKFKMKFKETVFAEQYINFPANSSERAHARSARELGNNFRQNSNESQDWVPTYERKSRRGY
jgi:hypothetical protein